MIKRIRSKIEYLRTQPEPVRLRAATTWTIVSGSIISLLWVTLLLPMEIKHNRNSHQASDTTAPKSSVAGIITSATPTPLITSNRFVTQPNSVLKTTSSIAPSIPSVVLPTPSASPEPNFIPVATPQ